MTNGVYIDILEGHDSKSPGYIDAIPSLTMNEENRLRRENEMLRIKKSEIEQLKEQAAEYEAFKSSVYSDARKINDKLDLVEKKVRERLGMK
jgi:hypothetical protein